MRVQGLRLLTERKASLRYRFLLSRFQTKTTKRNLIAGPKRAEGAGTRVGASERGVYVPQIHHFVSYDFCHRALSGIDDMALPEKPQVPMSLSH